jgi:hypothetical protein
MAKRAIVVVVVALVLGGTVKASVVRDKPTITQLLWNKNEAYLFIGQNLVGWRLSYVMLAVSMLSPYGPPSQNVKQRMTVVRITPSTIERRQIDGMLPPDLAAAEGRVATYGGALWTGTEFESQGGRLYGKLKHMQSPNFSDVDGWSKRTLILPGERTIDIEIGNQTFRLLSTLDSGNPVLDLDRGDGKRERLWSADGGSRWLSAREYDALFAR